MLALPSAADFEKRRTTQEPWLILSTKKAKRGRSTYLALRQANPS
jgi:hypothetical protein